MGGVLALQSIAPTDGMRRGFHLEYGSANSMRVGGIYTIGRHVLTAQYRHSDGFFLNEYKKRNCDPYDGLSLHWKWERSVSEQLFVDNTLREPFRLRPDARIALVFPRWEIYVRAENLTQTPGHSFYFKSVGNEFLAGVKPRTILTGISIKL